MVAQAIRDSGAMRHARARRRDAIGVMALVLLGALSGTSRGSRAGTSAPGRSRWRRGRERRHQHRAARFVSESS
jgi:hypothetical protein